MNKHEKYMRHCFTLAETSKNKVKSNPKVGSVLVYNDKVIGHGCYAYFGGDHAERNAISNVKAENRHLIKDATLYVSLEPCCVYGKTPPCSEMIVKSGIKNVVISTTDPNPSINGNSRKFLESHGIKITSGILEKEGLDLIRPFKANLDQIPYVILKFAQSADGYFGKRGKQVWLSNEFSKTLVHKWRAEVDGILVGFHTANIDNPSLTTRLVPGKNPLRFVLDKELNSNREINLWCDGFPTVFISGVNQSLDDDLKQNLCIVYEMDKLLDVLREIYKLGICTLMIEGGANTLKWFIEQQLWHEARIISSSKVLYSGIRAPYVKGYKFQRQYLLSDTIDYIYPSEAL